MLMTPFLCSSASLPRAVLPVPSVFLSLSGLAAFSHFHLKLGGVVPVRERRAFVRIERGRGVLKSASQDGAGRSGGR